MVFKLFSLGRGDQAASTALEKASRLRPTTSQATFDGAFASFEEQEDEEQRQRDSIREQVVPTLSTTTPSFQPSSVPLGRLVPGFLYGDSLMYGVGALRRIVQNHDERIWYDYPVDEDAKCCAKDPESVKLVHFIQPELILTRLGEIDETRPHRFLQYNVTGQDILKFVDLNRHHLAEDEAGELIFDKTGCDDTPLQFETELFSFLTEFQFDGWIAEFDDEFSREDMVYSITVDVTNKRITLLFRGSVLGGQDWSHDLDGHFVKVPPPRAVDSNKLDDHVKIHRGFQSYLHAPACRKIGGMTKFDRIIARLGQVMETNPGFELFITGHSLGGALCQLFAFQLVDHIQQTQSDGKSCQFAWPIQATSFASPQVGNVAYAQAFQAMEAAGLLRHLRFTNEGDLVPVTSLRFGYHQTGVNVFVREDEKAKVEYRQNGRSFFSQMRVDSACRHSMSSYKARFRNDINKHLFCKTIEEMYQEHASWE